MTIYAVAATNLYGLVALEELAKIANEYRVGAPPMAHTLYTQNPDYIWSFFTTVCAIPSNVG